MLGFTPISGAPVASLPDDTRRASAAQTTARVQQSAVALFQRNINANFTTRRISQYTTNNKYVVADFTTARIGQVAQATARDYATAATTTKRVTQVATIESGTLVRAAQTLRRVSQTATATVFWNLPGCGWIGTGTKALEFFERHLPMGAAWLAWRTPGKTAAKLVSAIASSLGDAWDFICDAAKELDPRTTVAMLPEWETALSLPDPCLPAASTINERRNNIIFRLQKRRWSTAADWHDLAALFGLRIIITPGWLVQKPALYPMCYPKRYDLFPKLGRFRVYIDIANFEYGGYDYGADGRGPGYPIPYGSTLPDADNFMCLIDRVRPAHVIVIWNQFPGRLACVPPEGV